MTAPPTSSSAEATAPDSSIARPDKDSSRSAPGPVANAAACFPSSNRASRPSSEPSTRPPSTPVIGEIVGMIPPNGPSTADAPRPASDRPSPAITPSAPRAASRIVDSPSVALENTRSISAGSIAIRTSRIPSAIPSSWSPAPAVSPSMFRWIASHAGVVANSLNTLTSPVPACVISRSDESARSPRLMSDVSTAPENASMSPLRLSVCAAAIRCAAPMSLTAAVYSSTAALPPSMRIDAPRTASEPNSVVRAFWRCSSDRPASDVCS